MYAMQIFFFFRKKFFSNMKKLIEEVTKSELKLPRANNLFSKSWGPKMDDFQGFILSIFIFE